MAAQAHADAAARFAQEVKVLRYLEQRQCNFVPKLVEADAKKLRIITTNCGSRVEHLDAERARELFAELETFGVRHDDPDLRNVTYRQSDGRFCLIDMYVPPGGGPPPGLFSAVPTTGSRHASPPAAHPY